MSDQKRERGARVKLGYVKRLTTKAGSDYFLGNLGPATKIVILPARRKDDSGEWETVDGSFDIFLEAKTEEEIAKDKAFWDSRRGNVSNAKPAATALADAPASGKGPGKSSLHKDSINDEIPFSLAPLVALAISAAFVAVAHMLPGGVW